MPRSGLTARPPTDAVLMTAPPWPAIHDRHASCVHRSGAHTLTSIVFANRAWSWLTTGPNAGFVPALLTRMSTLPNRSSANSTQAAAACSSVAWAP